jgi:hypothetical protein
MDTNLSDIVELLTLYLSSKYILKLLKEIRLSKLILDIQVELLGFTVGGKD